MVDKKDTKLAVRYDNDMNTVALGKLNATELDLFYTICATIKEKGTAPIVLDFDNIRRISDYKATRLDRFIADLKRTNSKLMSLNLTVTTEQEIIQFVLFPTFTIKPKEKTLTIEVNKRMGYLLNDITGNFTRFELQEFIDLKSSYSKVLYKHLKQFRKTGYYIVDIGVFREFMDIPPKYRMSEIDKKVLAPCIKELKNIYSNLSIKKIKDKQACNAVKQLVFQFEPEDDVSSDGKGLFRDDDGNYYHTDLDNFTVSQMYAKFPEHYEVAVNEQND